MVHQQSQVESAVNGARCSCNASMCRTAEPQRRIRSLVRPCRRSRKARSTPATPARSPQVPETHRTRLVAAHRRRVRRGRRTPRPSPGVAAEGDRGPGGETPLRVGGRTGLVRRRGPVLHRYGTPFEGLWRTPGSGKSFRYGGDPTPRLDEVNAPPTSAAARPAHCFGSQTPRENTYARGNLRQA